MIEVTKSPTADTRTCDYANTSRDVLLASSHQHIEDVREALAFFRLGLHQAGAIHDFDKVSPDGIQWFHSDFVTGFKKTGWWDNHRKIHRHHLDHADGIPPNVNLLDVLEHIADVVMAGMARAGKVYQPVLSDELLQRAFNNTVELLKSQVIVQQEKSVCPLQ